MSEIPKSAHIRESSSGGQFITHKPETVLTTPKDLLPPSEKPNMVSQQKPLTSLPIVEQKQNNISPPQFSASFTKPITEALSRCNISIEHINPVPLGQGANHVVYEYDPPGEHKKVIKIAKTASHTTLTHDGGRGAEEGISIAQKAFGSYAASAEVRIDPKDPDRYFVIQDLVKGKAITNHRIKNNPYLKRQLAEIVHKNNVLYKNHKMSLDFVGMPGFVGWIKSQFKKLLLRKSEFEVSNIIEDENGALKIIDFEYFRLADHVKLKQRFLNFIGMQANRILMKHYFGLDIKKEN